MKAQFLKLICLSFITSFAFYSCSEDEAGEMMQGNVQLFASNNANGDITVYNMTSNETSTFTTNSMAAEGIYYDEDQDEVIQASRSENRLDVYTDYSGLIGNISITAAISSSSDLVSPRDIAVNGNTYVVADNADVDGNPDTADGRLFIFVKSGSEFTLRNTVNIPFALWGIEFVGTDLYAVVDKTNRLAVFSNFVAENTSNSVVDPTKTVVIEGIVRTHGLAYDNGTMILTDVGSASSDADGAFHFVADFDSKFSSVANGGTLSANQQLRVAGDGTFLGNPVAAEYDAASNTVFIAEALNGGGRVLSFSNISANGSTTPTMNNTLQSASSLYFHSN